MDLFVAERATVLFDEATFQEAMLSLSRILTYNICADIIRPPKNKNQPLKIKELEYERRNTL